MAYTFNEQLHFKNAAAVARFCSQLKGGVHNGAQLSEAEKDVLLKRFVSELPRMPKDAVSHAHYVFISPPVLFSLPNDVEQALLAEYKRRGY